MVFGAHIIPKSIGQIALIKNHSPYIINERRKLMLNIGKTGGLFDHPKAALTGAEEAEIIARFKRIMEKTKAD